MANDGDGTESSPFTSAFITEVRKPGTEVRRLFDLVSDDVVQTTGDQQHPLTDGRVPGREHFFIPNPGR